MTKVYLWKLLNGLDQKMMGEYDREQSPDRFLFSDGVILSPELIMPKPIIRFEVKKEFLSSYDSLMPNVDIRIVNKRLAELLKKHAPTDIQLFEATILCPDGELKGYYILNVVNTIKGMDHERSVYKKSPRTGLFLSMQRIFYKPGCMGNHHLARDEEYKGHLLVSEFLKGILEKNNITGIRLVDPDEYYRAFHS